MATTPVATPNADMPIKYKAFLDSIKSAFATPDFSDLTVTCGEREWKVHKVIVCFRSAFFKSACKGTFKEASTNTIDLAGDDPDAVDAMLRYLYTMNYGYDDDLIRAIADARVYTIADKYDIPDLLTLAEHRFIENAKKAWKLDEFGWLIEEVHTKAADRDGKLTETLVQIAVTHAKDLYSEPHGGGFRSVVRTLPEFASDMNAKLVSVIAAAPRKAGHVHVKCSCQEDRKLTDVDLLLEGYDSHGYTACVACGLMVQAKYSTVGGTGDGRRVYLCWC